MALGAVESDLAVCTTVGETVLRDSDDSEDFFRVVTGVVDAVGLVW